MASIKTSETQTEIIKALHKFQGNMEKIKKDETNPFFKNKYAPLATVLDAIQKPLNDCDLCLVQFPAGSYQLITRLMHTSGEWMECSYTMTPGKDDPQGHGAVITYQRRYAIGAILSLNIDVDDDGNKASEKKTGEIEKPWLNKKTKEFNAAMKYLTEGGNIDSIEAKYKLSKEVRELLSDGLVSS